MERIPPVGYVTSDDKAAVNSAKAAYEARTDSEKSKIEQTLLNRYLKAVEIFASIDSLSH